jgi:acylphosphatase
MKTRAHVLVTGKVQGVYYRSGAKDFADSLGLTGWVRNNHDGRVEAVFEGEDVAVKKMVDWCWSGSPSSRVMNVEVIWEEPNEEFVNFSVTYGI